MNNFDLNLIEVLLKSKEYYERAYEIAQLEEIRFNFNVFLTGNLVGDFVSKIEKDTISVYYTLDEIRDFLSKELFLAYEEQFRKDNINLDFHDYLSIGGRLTNEAIKESLAHNDLFIGSKNAYYSLDHNEGNGALMRTYPFIFYASLVQEGVDIKSILHFLGELSMLTHYGDISRFSVLSYYLLMLELMNEFRNNIAGSVAGNDGQNNSKMEKLEKKKEIVEKLFKWDLSIKDYLPDTYFSQEMIKMTLETYQRESLLTLGLCINLFYNYDSFSEVLVHISKNIVLNKKIVDVLALCGPLFAIIEKE